MVEVFFPLIARMEDLVIQHADLIDETEIADAMRLLYRAEGLIVEGAAAVAVASALHRHATIRGRHVAVILCGGNVGWDVVKQVLG